MILFETPPAFELKMSFKNILNSNESLSLINQFTPCFLVSNVSLIKSILLAECFSEQLGQRLVPMMVFSQQPLEEAGDEHMTCRRSWFQSDVSSE